MCVRTCASSATRLSGSLSWSVVILNDVVLEFPTTRRTCPPYKLRTPQYSSAFSGPGILAWCLSSSTLCSSVTIPRHIPHGTSLQGPRTSSANHRRIPISHQPVHYYCICTSAMPLPGDILLALLTTDARNSAAGANHGREVVEWTSAFPHSEIHLRFGNIVHGRL
jgi:hypothetical protein